MSTNLEIKLKLNSFQEKLRLLKKLGAKQIQILNQKDIYYAVPKGLLKLRTENKKNTLIFYSREEKRKSRWSEFYLLEINDINPPSFFKKIFKVEAVVQKKRKLYLFNNTRIHLDYVKSLGKFLELETLVVNDKPDAEKRFKEIIYFLKLDQSKQIRKSYRDLIIEKKTK
jgi:predicted adenylyl cyclase CyaB